MKQNTELQQDKADALKAFRAAIRLKHSINADREINSRLPAMEQYIDEALARGEALVLSPAGAFDAV